MITSDTHVIPPVSLPAEVSKWRTMELLNVILSRPLLEAKSTYYRIS